LILGVWFSILVPTSASTLLVVKYVNQGYTTTQSFAATTIASVAYGAGVCISIMIVDKFESKYQFVIASLIRGIAFILHRLLIHDYVALAAAGFIGFAANSCLTACLFDYTAENFPTRLRSMASGTVEGAGSSLSTLGPIILVLRHPFGFLKMMIGLASFLFVAAAVIILLGKRSVGVSLEQLNK